MYSVDHLMIGTPIFGGEVSFGGLQDEIISFYINTST